MCAADKRVVAVPALPGCRSRGVDWKGEEQEQVFNCICSGGSERGGGAGRKLHPQEQGRQHAASHLLHHLLVVDYSKIDVVPRRVKTGAGVKSGAGVSPCFASVSALFSLCSEAERSSSLVGSY